MPAVNKPQFREILVQEVQNTQSIYTGEYGLTVVIPTGRALSLIILHILKWAAIFLIEADFAWRCRLQIRCLRLQSYLIPCCLMHLAPSRYCCSLWPPKRSDFSLCISSSEGVFLVLMAVLRCSPFGNEISNAWLKAEYACFYCWFPWLYLYAQWVCFTTWLHGPITSLTIPITTLQLISTRSISVQIWMLPSTSPSEGLCFDISLAAHSSSSHTQTCLWILTDVLVQNVASREGAPHIHP